MSELTKEQLFSQVQCLESHAFMLMGYSSNTDEFDRIMKRVEELSVIARENGWIK